MSLRATFSRNIYWPLVQKFKNEYAAGALNELADSQWETQDELLSRQWQLVRQGGILETEISHMMISRLFLRLKKRICETVFQNF